MNDWTEGFDSDEETAEQAPPAASHKQYPCRACGAKIAFDPAAASLRCPYCGHEEAVPRSEAEIRELDFFAALSDASAPEDLIEQHVVACTACGAETTLARDVTADACPFCGADIVTAGGTVKHIKPKSLLPFKVARKEAVAAFRAWVTSLWFAPNDIKRYSKTESKLSGLYVPYWTYDSDTKTFYRGERGDDYWETEHYTTTDKDGKTVRKTRQVRKTRWRSVRGTVWNDFDDILILASRSLPRKYADRLEPWDLEHLESYADDYLSGFRCESYTIDLEEGFEIAKDVMDDTIRASIREDIGGDHQRIHSMRTQYDDVTFKHLLLPVWISAYRYKDKAYRFLVNGRTGEVQGDRPWSWIKITLAVLAAAAVAIGIYAAMQS